MNLKIPVFIITLIITLPLSTFAETVQVINNGNTSWILTSTALVLFMTLPGLSLFYGGLVGTKNVLSVLMQGQWMFWLWTLMLRQRW